MMVELETHAFDDVRFTLHDSRFTLHNWVVWCLAENAKLATAVRMYAPCCITIADEVFVLIVQANREL